MRRTLLIATVLGMGVFCGTGCISTSIQRLPTFEMAAKKPAAQNPVLLFDEDVDLSLMPVAVPFAAVLSWGGELVSRDALARAGWREAKSLHSDFSICGELGVSSAGILTTDYGSFAVSQPLLRKSMMTLCFRICPAKLGMRFAPDGSLSVVDEDGSAKEAGLTEGDKPVSIDGIPIEAGNLKSAHFRRTLQILPGEAVKFVWIRPGTGRMEGLGIARPNSRTLNGLLDSIPAEVGGNEGNEMATGP